MARCVLDALACGAPLVERCVLYPGSVTNWFVGPAVPWTFPAAVPAPPPAEGFDPVREGWQPFDGAREATGAVWWVSCMLERGGVYPLGEPPRTNNAGAFCFARVSAAADAERLMQVGGPPPLTVWLNGERVWQAKVPHGYHPDADRFPVRLRKGENRLVVFSAGYFHISLKP